jgi:hypothetical protein
MDEDLRTAIEELKAAIERATADGVDSQERAALESLSSRIDSALGEEEESDGILDQLEETAIRFQENHPTLATVVRKVGETLSNYGI